MSGVRHPVQVILCACGPILREALDLDWLAEEVANLESVSVLHHDTLCSESGKAWLAEQTAQADDAVRTVVAACSPREHEQTFRGVLQAAGRNPYLLAMAAIREQAAWVTEGREEATRKALGLVRAAVDRVRRQAPLEPRSVPANPAVVVVGSGVAGITAARLLADAGRAVTLVERDPAVGGRVARLSDLHPGAGCASCVVEPDLDAVLHHDQVEVLTGAEVEEVLGFFGGFTVSVTQASPRVDPDACYGCHTCHEVCPVEVPREADLGLSTRKAVFVPYAGAVPNVSYVDPGSCLRDRGEPCDACAQACPFGAIDLSAPPRRSERKAGAIVVATGADELPLEGPWAETPRVVTAMGLERLMSESGPTGGDLSVQGKAPKAVAVIHGADARVHGAASAHDGLCCFLAEKILHLLPEALPEARLFEVVFDPEREVGSATPSTPSPRVRRLVLGSRDAVLGLDERVGRGALRLRLGGHEVSLPVDRVVVIRPLRGSGAALAERLRLEQSDRGFWVPDQAHLRPYASRQEGVFLAGTATGPRPVAEAVASGAAAAGAVLSALVPGREIALSPEVAEVVPEACGACHTCIVTCPYGAARHDPEAERAVIDSVLCRGCGACVAACPSGAIIGHHYTDEQLLAELEGLWEGRP